MIPDETGRYCNNCKKSVIDFTEKTDEEIQQFFIDNFSQSLCGRFKNTQIQRIVIDLPQNIFSIQMPLWMRFLVACLLIFGISIFPFETTVAGKPPVQTSFYQGEPKAAKTGKKPRILKRKKRKKHLVFSPLSFPWETMTVGYIPTPFPSLNESFFDSSNKVTYPSNVQSGAPLTGMPQKEQPRPVPFAPTEFILPTILSIRKDTNDQPMD